MPRFELFCAHQRTHRSAQQKRDTRVRPLPRDRADDNKHPRDVSAGIEVLAVEKCLGAAADGLCYFDHCCVALAFVEYSEKSCGAAIGAVLREVTDESQCQIYQSFGGRELRCVATYGGFQDLSCVGALWHARIEAQIGAHAKNDDNFDFSMLHITVANL